MRRVPLAGAALMASPAAAVAGLLVLARAPTLGLVLFALSAALAPVGLALALTGWGVLTRAGVATLLLLCVLGALVAGATAILGPTERYATRSLAALLAGLDAWGVLLAVRLWRHSSSFAATRPST